VRQKSDQAKKSAQPAAAKGSNTARVKAATYDGISSWLDYKSHFDACSRINQWSENEKGLYLAVSCLSDLLFYQIPCQQYCLLQLYVNMSGLPSLFAQLY
jgi:hypothetical protein